MATNKATASWTGTLEDGEGHMAFGEGAWEGNFSYKSRFKDEDGTNPEELLAAAHAGCFSMQFNAYLHNEGVEVESIETTAEVTLEPIDDLPTITTVVLHCTVKGAGDEADKNKIEELAEVAKAGCPVSRAIKGVDTVSLELEIA